MDVKDKLSFLMVERKSMEKQESTLILTTAVSLAGLCAIQFLKRFDLVKDEAEE